MIPFRKPTQANTNLHPHKFRCTYLCPGTEYPSVCVVAHTQVARPYTLWSLLLETSRGLDLLLGVHLVLTVNTTALFSRATRFRTLAPSLPEPFRRTRPLKAYLDLGGFVLVSILFTIADVDLFDSFVDTRYPPGLLRVAARFSTGTPLVHFPHVDGPPNTILALAFLLLSRFRAQVTSSISIASLARHLSGLPTRRITHGPSSCHPFRASTSSAHFLLLWFLFKSTTSLFSDAETIPQFTCDITELFPFPARDVAWLPRCRHPSSVLGTCC